MDKKSIEILQKQEVTSANRGQIMEQLKEIRLGNLKTELSSRPHDLNKEEQTFVSDCLRLRIESAGSMREQLDKVHTDIDSDFDRALVDTKEVRRLRAHHDSLLARYPTMAPFSVSAESYIFRNRKA